MRLGITMQEVDIVNHPYPLCRGLVVVLLTAITPTAAAQWLPRWAGTIEYPAAIHAMEPHNIHVAGDGAVLAGIDLVHHNASHAALARFEPDGTLSWLHEREAPISSMAGIELLAAGRVALAGMSLTGVFLRIVDSGTGELVWERESGSGMLNVDDRHDTRHIAQGPDGTLMVALDDGGDFVVVRFDADGGSLPVWRSSSGLTEITANEIASTADGGAIVTGGGGTGEGFHTVRFDPDGNVRFADIELGEISNSLGPARVRITDDDAAIIVASPETGFGVPGAMAWKLDSSGKRLWTVELSDQSSTVTTFANGPYVLSPAGDPLIAVNDVFNANVRVIRLDGDTGKVAMDHIADTEASRITSLALSANGRVLAGGYAFIPGGGGRVSSRIVEFAASGPPCRHADDLGMNSFLSATAGPAGWFALGIPPAVADVGSDARVLHFDANGPCDNGVEDDIFANGFELP